MHGITRVTPKVPEWHQLPSVVQSVPRREAHLGTKDMRVPCAGLFLQVLIVELLPFGVFLEAPTKFTFFERHAAHGSACSLISHTLLLTLSIS